MFSFGEKGHWVILKMFACLSIYRSQLRLKQKVLKHPSVFLLFKQWHTKVIAIIFINFSRQPSHSASLRIHGLRKAVKSLKCTYIVPPFYNYRPHLVRRIHSLTSHIIFDGIVSALSPPQVKGTRILNCVA